MQLQGFSGSNKARQNNMDKMKKGDKNSPTKKAQTIGIKKLLVLALGIFVVVLIIIAVVRFDIPNLLKDIFPTFGNYTGGGGGGGEKEVPEFVFKEEDYRNTIKFDYKIDSQEGPEEYSFWTWFNESSSKVMFRVIKVTLSGEDLQRSTFQLPAKLWTNDMRLVANAFDTNKPEELKVKSALSEISQAKSKEDWFSKVSQVSDTANKFLISFQIARDNYYGEGRFSYVGKTPIDDLKSRWNQMNTNYRYIKCAQETIKKC